MVLISSIALSITACGGKKKEEAKSAVVEQKQIAEAAVALSNEPEVVEYTCRPELYEAKLEDGLVQIEDILIETKKSQTLSDIRALFPESRFSLTVERADGTTAPFSTEAIAAKGENIILNVLKNGSEVCWFRFYNCDSSSDFTALDNCSYKGFSLLYQTEPNYPIWIAKGISPFEITYNDIEEYLSGYEYEKYTITSYSLDLEPSDLVYFQNDKVVQAYLHYDLCLDNTTGKVGTIQIWYKPI